MSDLVGLYEDLHRHPELSGQEHRTAARVAAELVAAGFATTTGVGGTGVVGMLRRGDGPVVMLRADMDALPMTEKTGLPYASEVEGVMHGCGHDMHTACLVGAAHDLAGSTGWAGTLLLVFQPAEELGRGARDMVEDGLFDRFPRPDVVLGQHVTSLPPGVVGHRAGPALASADCATVRLFGRGGHGAIPDLTVDPVLMAASTVVRLQGVVAREVPPAEPAVLSVGQIHAGTKDTIIPDEATLGLTVRAYSTETRAVLRAAVERIVRAEAAASGAPRDPEIDWHLSVPALVNDPAATRHTMAALAAELGADRLVEMPTIAASEDVGVFGAAAGVPTVFWFWGGATAANHSPEFAPVLDPTLDTGVRALVTAATAWLTGGTR